MNDTTDEKLIQVMAEFSAQAPCVMVEPAADRKEMMRQKLMRRVRASAPPLGSFTLRASEEDWVDFSPTIRFKTLAFDEKDNMTTLLLRLLPGAIYPEHENQADEECFVLEGSIRFGDHAVNAGDFHFMGKGHRHPEMFSANGALVYLRTRLD